MNLYPCAYSMTFNVTKKEGCDKLVLNGILNQRSQDVLAANNWNVCQYAILLHMLAQVCDMQVGEFVHVIADAHIYDRHIPIVEELIKREVYPAPKVELELSAKDKLTYNTIKVDKKMHNEYRSNYLRRYGRLIDVDKVEKDEALNVTLDNGDMRIEEAYVGLISMTDEERKPWIGKKVGYKTTININEMYSTPAQRAAMLHVKEQELEGINPEFELEITMIRQFANPELNEEFFKTAFPEGNITDKEGLDAYIDAQIEGEMVRECDYMFAATVRNFMLEKAALAMPTEFLKRWLYTINEGKFTMEDIEKDFDGFIKMFSWNYIQRQIITAEQITVTDEEATAEAKDLAAMQFAQYGMPNAPEEMVANFAKNILENKEQKNHIYEKLYEQKVIASIRAKVKVTEKAVSADEFAEIARSL